MTKGQKIFLGASLMGLLLGIPLLLWAQITAGECCRLFQDIKVKDFTYACNNNAYCSATTGNTCKFKPGANTFKKYAVIGAGDCDLTTTDTCEWKGTVITLNVESEEWGTVCLLNAVYNVTNWLFFFFLAIAILVGVVAGYYFMTAAGDERKIEKGRSLLTYMAIGLIVAALAKVIPVLVRGVIGI